MGSIVASVASPDTSRKAAARSRLPAGLPAGRTGLAKRTLQILAGTGRWTASQTQARCMLSTPGCFRSSGAPS